MDHFWRALKDHVDLRSLERALLRRQGLRVSLLEHDPPDDAPVALWIVAPHLPEWLSQSHRLTSVGPGCQRLETGRTEALWIAANELPLHESLLPLLVARSGKKLAELVRWLVGKRPAGYVTRVVEWSSMSPELARELQAEIEAYDLLPKTPEEKEAALRAGRIILAMTPELKEELVRDVVREAELRQREAAREGERARREAHEAVCDLCEALGIEVDDARRAYIVSLAPDALAVLRVHLKAHRSWPG